MDFQSILKRLKTNRKRRGVVGVEAAIVLIAFVIVAAALAFVVLNMGFSTTQKAKTTITEGLASSSAALEVSGLITGHANTTSGTSRGLDIISIPIKLSSGSGSIDFGNDTMAVRYLSRTVSFDNIYKGPIDSDKEYGSLKTALDEAITNGQVSDHPLETTPGHPATTTALVYWDTNINNNNVLDPGEHAILVVVYSDADEPAALDRLTTEVILPRGSTLSVERTVPTITDTYMNLS